MCVRICVVGVHRTPSNADAEQLGAETT